MTAPRRTPPTCSPPCPRSTRTPSARLHARLAAAASAAGILDVAYRTVDTPVGALLLAATEQGLVRVAYAREDHDRVLDAARRPDQPAGAARPGPARRGRPGDRGVLRRPAHRVRPAAGPPAVRTASAARCCPTCPRSATARTASYAALAAAAGNPKAVRAVGTACATNPLPVVVPCHRVVRSDGTIGQYVGGTEAKTALLALECRHAPHL